MCVCQFWTEQDRQDRWPRPKEEGEVWEFVSDLEEVQLASAHARHALANGRLDGGARDVALFEYAPFGSAEDGAWWELFLELALCFGECE